MNELTLNNNLTMTSREIADLVEKRHDKVFEEINNLGFSVKREMYVFDHAHKRDSFIVVAQLSPEFTARLVDRWQELETAQPAPAPATPLLPEQRAESIISVFARLATAHKVPMSFALQLAGVEATKVSGLPFDRLLTQAEAMNDVPDEDVMLEPTELGERLGFGKGKRAAIEINKMLERVCLQNRVEDYWEPTPEGAELCSTHAWTRGKKSGYNIKWRLSAIKSLFDEYGITA
ncbi:Rha family transcriptional regulator [Chromatium okenii]|uniref:Rha family transcriptional regulator n=1 Tax=Chromatium okenii TaxID=61644 RepID=UPI0026F16A98|nr:Rha family transcriptional regulator [Chromatium okenii]MBV5310805.1 Rha family transcriptional regulator [Chromatium okenii]